MQTILTQALRESVFKERLEELTDEVEVVLCNINRTLIQNYLIFNSVLKTLFIHCSLNFFIFLNVTTCF